MLIITVQIFSHCVTEFFPESEPNSPCFPCEWEKLEPNCLFSLCRGHPVGYGNLTFVYCRTNGYDSDNRQWSQHGTAKLAGHPLLTGVGTLPCNSMQRHIHIDRARLHWYWEWDVKPLRPSQCRLVWIRHDYVSLNSDICWALFTRPVSGNM